jgi:phosphatidylinositol glycan class S
VPSSGRRPLRLLDASGQSTQFNSFILPQWGGIVILNPDSRSSVAADLDASFHTFRSQLSSLLGVHPFPHGVVNTKGRMSISDWQLDSLMRRRLLETTSATQETLSSIVKLVNQIENMPLGPGVRNDVRDSLAYMRNVCLLCMLIDAASNHFCVQVFAHSDSSIDGAVADAITASTLSSQAFFNPGMLALLYFPAEHIWVIYTPLFVPVGIPLLAAAVREFKSWRAGRRLGA